MARKKREGRGGAHGGAAGRDADRLSEYGDDAASMVSESTSAACSTLSGFTKQEEDGYYGGGGAASAVDSELLDALDQLTEKRGSTRVTGLESLLKYLQHSEDSDSIMERQMTVAQSLLACIRRATGDREAELACRALGALAVRIGPDEDEVVRLCSRPLTAVVTKSRHAMARAAAAAALALLCFVCSTDQEASLEAMGVLADAFSNEKEKDEELQAEALRSWGLLATAAPSGALWPLGRSFCDLLDSPSLPVRLAAGENLALLHDLKTELEKGAEGDGEGEGVGDTYSDGDVLWEEVYEKVAALVQMSSKRVGKDALKEQRKAFRALHESMAHGSEPEEQMNLPNGVVVAKGWAQLLRLHALRGCLQGGLHQQLQIDEVLRDILEVEAWDDEDRKGTILEKSGTMRKMQTESRTRDRSSRQNAKDYFLGGGDES